MSSQFLDDDLPTAGPSTIPESALVVVSHDDVAVERLEQSEWRPILSDSHQIVLYNSNSHALSVLPHASAPAPTSAVDNCPFCHRPLDVGRADLNFFDNGHHTRASNYFQLLEVANEINSRPPSRGNSRFSSVGSSKVSEEQAQVPAAGEEGFKTNAMAEGYFEAFFKEDYRLGMGANGSVFLCQVSTPDFYVVTWS